MKLRKPIKIICVSTYIPQRCGIATFTKDVTTAINLLNPYALVEIMAIVKEGENPQFPWEVKYKIYRSDANSYLQAASYINHSSCDLVLIEHEFGIFGGKCGEYLDIFLKAVEKPKVMTCHTIISDRQNELGQVFQKLVKNIDGLITMTQDGARKLVILYGVWGDKTAVIPHGTPDLTFDSTEVHKKKKGLLGKIIIGNINLLSENKGVDYCIEAVGQIVTKHPQILYLIIGQTHPNILEKEGEKYRNSLKQKIKKLGIQKNIRFINRYITPEELANWLKVIDIYVTPYLDPQQSSSGALAYAVGAGKLCISTKYLYAQEILDNGRGILVPFRDSTAIAESITKLLQNRSKREKMRKKAYKYGRFMTWASVALQHLDFFTEIIEKQKSNCKKQIGYFLKLTNKTGIVEHCKFDRPDYSEGYSVDDNARALQICLRLRHQCPALDKMLPTYFNFLKSAVRKDDFYSDLNSDKTWQKNFETNGEHCGRALAALGEIIKFEPDFSLQARQLFNKIYLLTKKVSSHPRVSAQIILGLKFYQPEDIKSWADSLVYYYLKEKTDSWKWFETVVSYDIGRLPLALLTAYQITANCQYLEIALESLDFLTKLIFDKKNNCFVFPGNKGWFTKDGLRIVFDQQPIEAGSATEVYSFAFQITKNKKYRDLAMKAFAWYSGDNILKANMVDIDSGGIFDGFNQKEINLNRGAESVISYLLAYDAIRSIDLD